MAWFDAVIVGGGLAGSLLSWRLRRAGWKILVYDACHPGSASRIAPGIINPLAGKRLHPAWRIGELLPEAIHTYETLSIECGQQFYRPLAIVRILQNEFEEDMLSRRQADPEASRYIGERLSAGQWPGTILDPRGSFCARGSGWVDLGAWLDCCQKVLRHQGCWRSEWLEYTDLAVSPAEVRGPGWTARTVVFCEGWRGHRNPWLKDLPFKPALGEMLDLTISDPLPEGILNSGKWLLPLGKGRYRAGATFVWDHLEEQVTESGRQEILACLARFLAVTVQVTGACAGVRPILRDYRAALGRIPNAPPSLVVFNGLGAKGALTAPWLSLQLLQYLQANQPLQREFDVGRFFR